MSKAKSMKFFPFVYSECGMEIEQTFWMCSIFGSFSQKCEIKTLPWKGIPYYNTFIFQNIAITLENGRVARVPGPVDRRAGSSSYSGDEGKLPGTSMWLTWTLYITSNIYCSLGVSLASTNIDKFRFIWVLIYYRENFEILGKSNELTFSVILILPAVVDGWVAYVHQF